jgi:hypothetical protein
LTFLLGASWIPTAKQIILEYLLTLLYFTSGPVGQLHSQKLEEMQDEGLPMGGSEWMLNHV